MIFVTAANEPAVFLMLSEADLVTMREGRTKFVDDRQTGGVSFQKVILSLHPTDEAALEVLRASGHRIPQLADPEPGPAETRCAGCGGLMFTESLFEGTCIICWAMQAKGKKR